MHRVDRLWKYNRAKQDNPVQNQAIFAHVYTTAAFSCHVKAHTTASHQMLRQKMKREISNVHCNLSKQQQMFALKMPSKIWPTTIHNNVVGCCYQPHNGRKQASPVVSFKHAHIHTHTHSHTCANKKCKQKRCIGKKMFTTIHQNCEAKVR